MTENSSKGWIILTVSVIAVAAIFAILFFTGKGSDKLVYNKFEFVNTDGVWQTEWEREGQLYILNFRHNPEQVESIPVVGQTDARFKLDPTYLTIDPPDLQSPKNSYISLALVELSGKLTEPFERDVIAACTKNETDACADRPIITCDTTNTTVIYLKYEEPAQISLNGNCAILQGIGHDIVMAADKALFQWLGIMD